MLTLRSYRQVLFFNFPVLRNNWRIREIESAKCAKKEIYTPIECPRARASLLGWLRRWMCGRARLGEARNRRIGASIVNEITSFSEMA